jgi:hypothetical protein
MSILAGNRGAWMNQWAPPKPDWPVRGHQVDHVIIKYGMKPYEVTAFEEGIPWLGERMAENGVGSQDAPAHAMEYANELANQVLQPGCIGGVINLEESDGGWHLDDGSATRLLISTFRSKIPSKPLFAALDTRANRPNSPYQQVCAELCDGVMPMVYPGAFELPAHISFAVAITPLLRAHWRDKDILPAYETYSPPDVDVDDEVLNLNLLYTQGLIQGASSYTLGHATDSQWLSSLNFKPGVQSVALPPDVAAALMALHKAWVDQWTLIATKGTVQEMWALADFWHKLVGL